MTTLHYCQWQCQCHQWWQSWHHTCQWHCHWHWQCQAGYRGSWYVTKKRDRSIVLREQWIQTCHNFVEGIRIFSVKICINPYHSSTHPCITILRNKINKNVDTHFHCIFINLMLPLCVIFVIRSATEPDKTGTASSPDNAKLRKVKVLQWYYLSVNIILTAHL